MGIPNHAMVDLETLDKTGTAVILSIGAVAFDPFGDITSEFYKVINIQDCINNKLTTSKSTIDWWGQQSTEAQLIIREAKESEVLLRDGLTEFSIWFKENNLKYFWACAPTFDAIILRNAYNAVEMNPPWLYFDELDYRTVRTLNPWADEEERVGVYHNALDDCKHQVHHLQKIFRGNK